MLSAEEFAEQKYDLPDAGRWHELVAGELRQFDPPDMAHGTVVLNLSKALAEYLHFDSGDSSEPDPDPPDAYACYELGLVVARDPDTVRCPPVSVFIGGEAFAETDREVTESVPGLVVEIASTADRRDKLAERVVELHEWGVGMVWVIDPGESSVHVIPSEGNRRMLVKRETLWGRPVLPGFQVPVRDLFLEPEWWTGKIRKKPS